MYVPREGLRQQHLVSSHLLWMSLPCQANDLKWPNRQTQCHIDIFPWSVSYTLKVTDRNTAPLGWSNANTLLCNERAGCTLAHLLYHHIASTAGAGQSFCPLCASCCCNLWKWSVDVTKVTGATPTWTSLGKLLRENVLDISEHSSRKANRSYTGLVFISTFPLHFHSMLDTWEQIVQMLTFCVSLDRILTGAFDKVVKVWSQDGQVMHRFDGFR